MMVGWHNVQVQYQVITTNTSLCYAMQCLCEAIALCVCAYARYVEMCLHFSLGGYAQCTYYNVYMRALCATMAVVAVFVSFLVYV